jgi:serine/threonine protein kinase
VLKGIQKLHNNGIVHSDLKANNIMMDSRRNEPIIIDFGQSWLISDTIIEEKATNIFFVFDQYNYWSIDVLICNYIIQQIGFNESKTVMVSESDLNYIYDIHIYGKELNKAKVVNEAFRYTILQNTHKMDKFKDMFYKYTLQFVNRTWWDLYNNILQYTSSWDSYSLSVIYLNILDDVNRNYPEIYRSMYLSNKHLQTYVEFMESVIYSPPDTRPSYKIILKTLEEF